MVSQASSMSQASSAWQASKASDKKQAANRRNASKSTGPRTPRGKARSSQNAVTHAVFCKEVCRAGEDQDKFNLLLKAYVHRLEPQDALELSLVEEIVAAQWRVQRCYAAEGLHLDAVADRARMMSLRKVQKTLAMFGWDDTTDEGVADNFDADDPIDQLRLRHTRLLEKSGEEGFTLPTDHALSMALSDKEDVFVERFSRYETRLHQIVHRTLAELEKLRGPKRKWSDLPPSPYLRPIISDESATPDPDPAADCDPDPKDNSAAGAADQSTDQSADYPAAQSAELNPQSRNDQSDPIESNQAHSGASTDSPSTEPAIEPPPSAPAQNEPTPSAISPVARVFNPCLNENTRVKNPCYDKPDRNDQ